MKRSTFWFLLAAINLAFAILGHGTTDLTIAFWACIILGTIAENEERRR